jgi:hypothetical protein
MESDESNLHTNSLMYTQFDHILGVAPQLARVRGRGFNIQHVSIFTGSPIHILSPLSALQLPLPPFSHGRPYVS